MRTFVASWRALVFMVLLATPAAATSDEAIAAGSLRWSSDARLGVSAGNVLLVPFVTPGPGAATRSSPWSSTPLASPSLPRASSARASDDVSGRRQRWGPPPVPVWQERQVWGRAFAAV